MRRPDGTKPAQGASWGPDSCKRVLGGRATQHRSAVPSAVTPAIEERMRLDGLTKPNGSRHETEIPEERMGICIERPRDELYLCYRVLARVSQYRLDE